MTEPNETNLLHTLSTQMADAVEQIRTSLVTVYGRPRQPASGIVIAPGIILTADHVLEREDDLTIQGDDGRDLPAQFAGRDPSSDLAILRVADLNATPATAANPARVGQIILAVGRPSSYGPMASLGVVSAAGGPLRSARGALLEQFLQTDATPYPGFSGGALIDANGAVVGVLTTGLINGVPLAVPVGLAWQIAESLAAYGHIKRGYLGISSQPVALPEGQRGGREQERGLLIVRVEQESPAAQAGILLGDILVGLDGQVLTDTDDLQGLLSGERVGKPVPIELIRGGVLQTLSITIGQRR